MRTESCRVHPDRVIQRVSDIDGLISKNNQYVRVTAEDTPYANDCVISWRHFQLYACVGLITPPLCAVNNQSGKKKEKRPFIPTFQLSFSLFFLKIWFLQLSPRQINLTISGAMWGDIVGVWEQRRAPAGLSVWTALLSDIRQPFPLHSFPETSAFHFTDQRSKSRAEQSGAGLVKYCFLTADFYF